MQDACWCEQAQELCAIIRQSTDATNRAMLMIEQLLATHNHDITPVPEIRWRDVIINTEANVVSVAGERIKLTKTEWKILRYLALNKNQWCSSERVIDEVWGFNNIDGVGDNGLLRTHICHLRSKLPVNVIESTEGGYRCALPEDEVTK